MALFDKLFSLKRRLDSENCEPRRDRGRSCQINPEQVRLLLYKECDWRGRRLLFDSTAIHKVPAGKNDKPTTRKTDETPCIVEVSNGYTYVYKGPEADASVLGEMIFGAVAMNCKSVSLKIHIMDEPRRLMCTKVFCVPVSRRISRVERKTSDRLDVSIRSVSKPLSVPLKEEGVSLSFSLDRGDSGFCGDQSPYSSVSSTYDYFSMFETWDGSASHDDFSSFHSLPGRKLSTSSNGSWQRRTFQNIATRFDLGQSSQLLNLPASNASGSDSQIYSNSSTSGTSDSLASGVSVPQRKSKLGLAVLITVNDSAEMDLVRRCVEHSPQVQALVCRLRLAVLSAGAGAFVSTLHAAAENAATWLSDLIYGPRVQPMWLSLLTQTPRVSHKLAESLLADLCSVLAVGDTKTTHFFISTLLTHVLTYHLGWVTTVSPYDTVEHPPPSKARPYNALWAQLSDLCGSIGFPPRAARTILTGEKNHQFINKLLLVLTYFLRCGDVTRNVFQYQDSVIKESKTICVSETVCGLKRTATQRKLDCEAVNTQNSDSSVSTVIASEVSFKRSPTLANLSKKLESSTGSEVGSSGEKSTGLRRNPTMMLSTKSSSDSSLNSNSDEPPPEQKVLFVLGDDEKLVGLKNKSNGGKMVKKSSKVHSEVKVEQSAKASDNTKNLDSPSKCCGQTLQHSKPIKHSGFKFEFDKYPQIVTNYMKSKNLEILDRHYIGKPGNLKLDNFQFDPTIVPAIQEERCETCVKCQMESMLQTPTNASEMEYMNDMPRALEPQYAEQKVVTDMNNKREMSPKTFVRKRKDNTVVVNLVRNMISVSDGEVNREFKDSKSDRISRNVTPYQGLPTIPVIRTPPNSTENTRDDEMSKILTVRLRPKGTLQTSKLKATKSLGNLNLLISEIDDEELDTTPISTSDWKISSIETLQISSNDVKSISSDGIQKFFTDESKIVSSNKSITCVSSIVSSRTHNTISSEQKSTVVSERTSIGSPDEPKSSVSSNNLSTISLNEEKPLGSPTTISSIEGESTISSKELISPISDEASTTVSSNEVAVSLNEINPSVSSSEVKLAILSNEEKAASLSEMNSIPSSIKPTLLELKIPEPRRRSRDVSKTVEVKRVIEFPLPKICSAEDTTQKSGFDGSLLGGITDHYVPDLILQGTLAKPITWESDLRRDLDLTTYLNKTIDAPIQAVAIIGDTNTWEVRVVGRDCGTGGMSSLVGTMLDAVPAMWKAKVPAHQCLSFLESKLREFCVLSKTLADMLMSTDFCDIATLTKSLNIDVNDVPLLLAVATTHTPQVATRYGLSYR